MTALDIFLECAAVDGEIDSIREKIERRRALASGCTARPLSPDGGSIGSGDASMRMLDYMGDIDRLNIDLEEQKTLREVYRSCCFYLAELLSPTLAKVALRIYLEHKSVNQIANEIRYSPATVKRYKRQAEDNLRLIEIIYWDKVHVPMIVLRDGFYAPAALRHPAATGSAPKDSEGFPATTILKNENVHKYPGTWTDIQSHVEN